MPNNMNIQSNNGKIILKNGKIGTGEECCCIPPPPPPPCDCACYEVAVNGKWGFNPDPYSDPNNEWWGSGFGYNCGDTGASYAKLDYPVRAGGINIEIYGSQVVVSQSIETGCAGASYAWPNATLTFNSSGCPNGIDLGEPIFTCSPVLWDYACDPIYGDWGGTEEERCQKARQYLDDHPPEFGFRVCGECVDFPPQVTVSLGEFELQDEGQGFICPSNNLQSWVAPAGKWPSGNEAQEMRELWGYDQGLDWIANLDGDYVLSGGGLAGGEEAEYSGNFQTPGGTVQLRYRMNCEGCGVLTLITASFGAPDVNGFTLWDFCNGHADFLPPLPAAERELVFSSVPNDDRRGGNGARLACYEWNGEQHTKTVSQKTGGNVLITITGVFWYAPTGYFIGSATVRR